MTERAIATERPRSAGWRVWLLWVLASAAGWGLGGALIAPVSLAVDSVLVLSVSGGIVVGILQWLVLRQQIARAGWWIVGSTVGGLVCGAWGPLLLVVVVSGLVAGVLQWLVLRRQIARAGWWVVASTVGWASGRTLLVLVGVVVALIVAEPLAGVVAVFLVVVAAGAVGGTVGGVVEGAITGTVLVWLLRQRLVDSDGAGSEAARAEVMGDRDSGYASAG